MQNSAAQQENRPLLIDWLVLIALMLIWGSSFILIKKGLVVFSSLQLGALRVSISFLALLPLAIFRLSKIKKKNIHLFIIAGLLGNGIPAFLFAKAQTGMDSYMAGILNSLTPLFTLIAGVLFFGRHTKFINVFGVIIGLIGAIGLLSVAGAGSFSLNIGPASLIIIATICYAFQMNFIKNYLTGYDPVTIASVAFIFIGIPSLAFLLSGTDFVHRMTNVPGAWEGLGFVSILAVFGTSIAIIANFWLIKRTSAMFSSSVTYLMPIVSTLWGIVDGESFLIGFAIWIIIILAGVYMANRPVKKGIPAVVKV
ncbi:MAG: EamA family transporter [Bacteroidales bacterium]|nr:EamA family transporter [Bacteroidales bacterium]